MGVPECRLEDDYSKDPDNSVCNCVQETIEDRPYGFHHVELLKKGRAELHNEVGPPLKSYRSGLSSRTKRAEDHETCHFY